MSKKLSLNNKDEVYLNKEKHLRGCINDVITRPEYNDIEFNNHELGHFISRVIENVNFNNPDPNIQYALRENLRTCWYKGTRQGRTYYRLDSDLLLSLEEEILFRIAEKFKEDELQSKG